MGINDCAKSALTPLRKLKTNIFERTTQQGRTLLLLKCINTKEVITTQLHCTGKAVLFSVFSIFYYRSMDCYCSIFHSR
jgi:hypothetical protein